MRRRLYRKIGGAATFGAGYYKGGRATFGGRMRRRRGKGFKESLAKFARKAYSIGKKVYHHGKRAYKFYQDNPQIKQSAKDILSFIKGPQTEAKAEGIRRRKRRILNKRPLRLKYPANRRFIRGRGIAATIPLTNVSSGPVT